MTNPFRRGSAPGRERPDYLRPSSFKPGHEKRGGRERGTPNAFSPDYKRAILEAAYRIGNDGNGKDGVVGYFAWVALRHPRIFCTVLLINILPLEFAEELHGGAAALDQRRTQRADSGLHWARKQGPGKEANCSDQVWVTVGLDRPGFSCWLADAARGRESEGFLHVICRGFSAAADQTASRTRRTARLGAASASRRRAMMLRWFIREADDATRSSKSLFLRTTLSTALGKGCSAREGRL